MAKKKKIKNKKLSLKEQEKAMISRYGHSAKWVDVQMHLTHQEMLDYFGPQCEEFEPLCANCTNWVMWHKTGKAEVMFERDELVKLFTCTCNNKKDKK